MTEALRIAAYAEARGLGVILHDCAGPVVWASAVHTALHLPNAVIHECVRPYVRDIYPQIVSGVPELAGGTARPAPGLRPRARAHRGLPRRRAPAPLQPVSRRALAQRAALVSAAGATAAELSRERLGAAADLLLDYPFRVWHYGESVGLEGLLCAARLTARPELEGWVHGLVRGWAARRRPFAEIDNTLPGKVLCELAERHGDELLLEAALDAAEHLGTRRRLHGVALPFERAPLREPFGGAPLDAAGRALLADPGPGIFVDPLHFDPPFLVHLGALTGSPDLVDAGAAQAVALVELLQDDSGAFWHFFLERTGRRYGLGWGRGQGWALLGLVDVLERLPGAHPGREPLVSALIRLADALCATQRDDGSWFAVISDPGSGPESSTAAFAAAGLARAVAQGWLTPGYLDAARLAWSSTAAGVAATGRSKGSPPTSGLAPRRGTTRTSRWGRSCPGARGPCCWPPPSIWARRRGADARRGRSPRDRCRQRNRPGHSRPAGRSGRPGLRGGPRAGARAAQRPRHRCRPG